MAKVRDIQVCGGHMADELYDACQEYIKRVDGGIDREKLNFAVILDDGTIKHITIRQMDEGVVAYGDFDGMPNALEWAQELLRQPFKECD